MPTTPSHQENTSILKSSKGKILDKAEEYQLMGVLASEGKSSTRGQAALAALRVDNERLVMRVVRRALELYPSGRRFEDDLKQAGYMGLMKAINKFDVKTEFRLATFAEDWVRKYVYSEMRVLSSTIRLPDNIYKNIAKLNEAKRKLYAEDDYNIPNIPLTEELAQRTGFTIKKIERLRVAPTITDLPTQTYDDDFEEDGINQLPDKNSLSPEEEVIASTFRDKVQSLLKQAELLARDKEIIARRFGFEKFNEQTIEKIAEDLGVSAETVRKRLKSILDDLFFLALKNGVIN